MSTSPTFDPVVLFWGQAWWLPGQSEPVPVADPGQAAAVLAAAWPCEDRRLRLLYEPDGFRAEAAECPQANRTTLGWALSDRFPELVEPERGWSHEPIRAHDGGFVTMLHLEAAPELFPLVEALAQAGLTVTAAWPVPTWLQMLPSDLSDTGAFVGALLSRDRVCLYYEAADGRREVKRWQGPEALEHGRNWLGEHLAKHPDTPVWLVPDHCGLMADFDLPKASDEPETLTIVPVDEALAREAVFPSRHPAQLLPPVSRLSQGALLAVASWAVLVGAISWAALSGWTWFRAQRLDADQQPRLVALRTEVAHLEANAAEIARLQAAVETPPAIPASGLLVDLTQDLPSAIVFDRIEFDGSQLEVDGWTPPDTDPLPAWLAQRKASHPDWEWRLATPQPGSFQLRANPS